MIVYGHAIAIGHVTLVHMSGVFSYVSHNNNNNNTMNLKVSESKKEVTMTP